MAYNDKFGYHEVIHTAHIFASMWYEHVLMHGLVDLEEPELKELGEEISKKIWDFYQLVSNKSDDKFNK